MSDDPAMVELVGAQVVRPLRRTVLRPGQGAEQTQYRGDDDRRSAHAAVRLTRSGPANEDRSGPGVEDLSGPGVEDQSGADEDTDEGTVVAAVGTVLPEAPPWEPERVDSWRIRGMATRPDARRRGLGRLVLDALLDHVGAHGGGLVWCNARVPAQTLYARAGFAPRGPVFDIPGIGPHVQMFRTVGDESV